MGIDIHVRIIKKNRDTNTWEHVKLYRKESEKFEVVNVYPYRNYDLFDILNENAEDGYKSQSIITIDLPPHLKQEIEKNRQEYGYYSFKEVNLADLKLYLNRVPKVRNYDYDEDNPKAMQTNPVEYFIDRIEHYLDFADPYWDLYPASDIRILYWFDR
jgi:hypothetical protein